MFRLRHKNITHIIIPIPPQENYLKINAVLKTRLCTGTDVKIMYDTQITRVEKIESENVRCRFLEDAVSLYKYLDATEAEAEKHESVQVASMSKHSETLLYVLTEFLSKSIRSEAHVTEQSELKRIRSIREQKIEKCFEEFRATVQRAIDANQSLEQQADAYASQIRSDHTKRLKELHRSSKRRCSSVGLRV